MADGLLNVKGSFGHYEEKSVEHIPSHDESCRGNGGETKLSPEAEAELAATDRKILFKMDILIIPIITMLYLLVFIDRANIGNARVAGLSKDLELTDLQYKTAVTVTYVLYIAAELPSNLVLKKVGSKVLLPLLCLSWGIVTTLQCLVTNYRGLVAARLMLGLAEGGLFPGINLYLSMFYRRQELQLRIAMFYSFCALSGAFSGLLAYAISLMDGIAGLAGWQWIFCLEGLFTVVFAPVAYFLMPNSPRDIWNLTAEQKERCLERIRDEAQFSDEQVTISAVLSVYKSVHMWPMLVSMFCGGLTVFGLAFFSPSIVLGMGYTANQAQLMTVPPFAVAFVVSLCAAYISDRYRMRGATALAMLLIALIGIVLFYKGRSDSIRYTSLFFLVTGAYASGPCILAWVPNNIASHVRRATAIATAFVCTNVGGMVSTWIFPTKDAPYYTFASRFIISIVLINIAAIAVEIVLLTYLNKRKDNPAYRETVLRDVVHLDVAQQMVKLGDAHPNYKYIV